MKVIKKNDARITLLSSAIALAISFPLLLLNNRFEMGSVNAARRRNIPPEFGFKTKHNYKFSPVNHMDKHDDNIHVIVY